MKPILQWVGGKRQILHKLLVLIPKDTINTYYEPFFGAGALGLALEPTKAVYNDINSDLMSFYSCFKTKEDYDRLVMEITKYPNPTNETTYYKIRDIDLLENYQSSWNKYQKAARMNYLNKASYGALYRVNKKGHFNAPWGKKEHIHLFDKEEFDDVFSHLSQENIKLTNVDFEEAVKDAKAGDFVYFDPPYDIPDGKKDSFTGYTKNGFGKEEQIRLAKVFKELTDKGVKCMITNHDTELINQLYGGYQKFYIKTNRVINSKSEERKNTGEEIIIINY